MPVLQDLEELAPVINPIIGSVANAVGTGKAVGDVANQAQLAANTIQGTGAQSAATQADVLAQQKQLLNPWLTAGTTAVGTLSSDPSLTAPFSYSAADMTNDPSYEFTKSEGQKGINTAAAARGLYDSGGALKQLDQYNTNLANQFYDQNYKRSESTFRANQASRLGLLQNLSNSGQQAANTESAATGQYGAATTQNNQFTADQLTQIQGAIAEAQAAGDVSKANALGSLIKGGVNAAPIVAKALGVGANAAQLAAPAVIGGLEGTAAAGMTALPSAASAVSAAGGSMGAIAPETSLALGGGGAGGGGIGSAAIGFLTNPITIGVGAAILAVTAILKSQAHWEANTLVKDVQNPFGENLGKIVNGFDQALASGQLDRATAQQMRDQTAAVINDFNNKVYEFAQGGSDEKEVALNAMQTMADNFGARSDYPNLPSYDKILGKMDAEIAGLA